MPYLEQSIDQLNKGLTSFESLIDEHGGKVDDIGLSSTIQLEEIDKKLLSFTIQLQVGEHSPPYTTPGHYNILKVIERKDPKPQSLDTVKQEVINDYLNENYSVIYSRTIEPLIKDLVFNEKNIKQFIKNPTILQN